MAKRGASYKFVQAPPKGSMRRRTPTSAPRLFEWLVDNGYVEPITTLRTSRAKRRASRR
jgi:hypothetical protein